MKKIDTELRLIEIYSPLLSEKKMNYVSLYYFEDLSLSEIADIYNVSRAAVHESIKDSIKELYDYENKLKLIKKQDQRIDFIKKNVKDNDIINKYLSLELEK